MDIKHSRRSFLQTAGAAGVVAAVGQVSTARPVRSLIPSTVAAGTPLKVALDMSDSRNFTGSYGRPTTGVISMDLLIGQRLLASKNWV